MLPHKLCPSGICHITVQTLLRLKLCKLMRPNIANNWKTIISEVGSWICFSAQICVSEPFIETYIINLVLFVSSQTSLSPQESWVLLKLDISNYLIIFCAPLHLSFNAFITYSQFELANYFTYSFFPDLGIQVSHDFLCLTLSLGIVQQVVKVIDFFFHALQYSILPTDQDEGQIRRVMLFPRVLM